LTATEEAALCETMLPLCGLFVNAAQVCTVAYIGGALCLSTDRWNY